MAEFEVTEEKIDAISRQFKVDIKTVKTVHNIFSDVILGIKDQYLAHIIRCMESYCRKRTGNQMFQINCYPLDPASPQFNVGCAQYFPKRYFSIFFHPNMDEKQLRACLAHELGHLFIIELANESRGEGAALFDEKTLTEPLSSIFGVFAIMDKNDFYGERCGRLNHDSWRDIVQEFISMQNRVAV